MSDPDSAIALAIVVSLIILKRVDFAVSGARRLKRVWRDTEAPATMNDICTGFEISLTLNLHFGQPRSDFFGVPPVFISSTTARGAEHTTLRPPLT